MCMSSKAQAYILILRWTIALIFFLNGAPKLNNPDFGAEAERFFYSLKDDIIFGPYKLIFKNLVLPNVYLISSFVKYAEIFLAATFFFGFPLRFSTYLASFLHLNYLCIASFPTFIYLNMIMIVAEWVCMSAAQKE